MPANFIIWTVIGLALAGLLLRPRNWPEAIWPAGAALFLVLAGLLPARAALHGIMQGGDVYLFLAGMMLLAELARSEGLFDWLAAHAVAKSGGSAWRLFALTYLTGILVTVFLSNDATAVVLTPAVAAVARSAKLENRLPFLLICAFVANAASFVLPISNPANLVIYGTHLPALGAWLPRFALPSAVSIIATYLLLCATQAKSLAQPVATSIRMPALSGSGRVAACGIAGMAVLLVVASGFGDRLGLPTFIAGLATAAAVGITRRSPPWTAFKALSWNVLILVAGLFVLVQALAATGILQRLSLALRGGLSLHPEASVWGSGFVMGIASNLVNNLPAGLIAGQAAAQLAPNVTGAMLLGVDLGPNLSVTGSLATILWLAALRREGITVTTWQFLKLGFVVMPPALLLALLVLILQ